MDVKPEVAEGLTALVRTGQFDEAMERYYDENIVSIEGMGGDEGITRGLSAVRASGVEWYAQHEVHGVDVTGPYLCRDEFAITMRIDMTEKASGNRMTFEEIGLYTIKDGKIVQVKFFYGGM